MTKGARGREVERKRLIAYILKAILKDEPTADQDSLRKDLYGCSLADLRKTARAFTDY
jgi:hypothetical protein